MEYLTCNDIAKDLGLTNRAIQKYIKEGFLPASFTFVRSKKVYQINPQIYFEWKQKTFTGVKQGMFSKYTSSNRPLTMPDIRELVSRWLEALSAGTLNGKVYSQTTIENYSYFINYYLRLLGERPSKPLISKTNLRQVFNDIPVRRYSIKQKLFDSLMCFAKFLVEENKLSDPEREAIKTLKPKRFIPAVKVTVSVKQVEQTLELAQRINGNTLYDKLLTQTLIIFFKETGLRASELCSLKLEDVNLEARVVYVWLGKGNKNRKVGLTETCYKALMNYIGPRSDFNNSDRFFVNNQRRELTPDSLRLKWTRLSKHLGFKVTCHSFRRHFITENAAKGLPLNHLRIACGHSDLATTQGYLTTSQDEVVKAMQGW